MQTYGEKAEKVVSKTSLKQADKDNKPEHSRLQNWQEVLYNIFRSLR